MIWRVAVTAMLVMPLLAELLAAQSALPYGVELIRRYGQILQEAKWSKPNIPVCWEDLGDATPGDRALVQQAIHASWEGASKVRFTGWGACVGDQSGIHLAVRDETPQALQLGHYLSGRPSGITLNFELARWTPLHCQSREACIKAIAIHEFGHGLGFSHEQNRADRPDWCKEASQGAEGDFFVTEYDEKSIMNYCNAGWTGQGGLSARDVESVAKVYGL